MRAALLLLSVLAACAAPRGPIGPQRPTTLTPTGGEQPATDEHPAITWTRVAVASDLPGPLPPGAHRLHLIDVGTGLAILVQGHDFAMLYDAGTNDRDERPLRVVAYLAAVLGPSGDELCVEPGAPPPTRRVPIENVVLSHPHLDHASALDLVLHCYEVAQFWDSGRMNSTVFYRELLAGIAGSATTYRTALEVPADHQLTVKGLTVTMPRWQRFSEGDAVQLGDGARFTILHANPKGGSDPNQSSVVLALELGRARVLLVGDAESGERKDPSYPVGDVEEYLIDHHREQLRSDILQVGHHGSMTSTRHDFLVAVQPSIALVSSGPKRYGKTTLPDREVIDELTRGNITVLRTDERDDNCPVTGRIGGDTGAGGCDTWVLTIGP
jgi:competence protein ComEC